VEINKPKHGTKDNKHNIKFRMQQKTDSNIDNIIFKGTHKQHIQQ
jgi:hypothetical protein